MDEYTPNMKTLTKKIELLLKEFRDNNQEVVTDIMIIPDYNNNKRNKRIIGQKVYLEIKEKNPKFDLLDLYNSPGCTFV